MTIIMDAPWHKASFDRFLHERLPHLLAEHVPLLGYAATATDPYTCQIELTLSSPTGEVIVAYAGLPQPDQEGVFQIDGKRLVVVPYAAHDDLENAEIFCVGEQLEAHLRQRLGKAPDDLAWDTALARAWLPLNLWIGEFFERPPRYAWPSPDTNWTTFVQSLDDTNWLARHGHLRRLSIMDCQHLFRPGHFGRTCPFETPEGPNIGRILPIALGAAIRDGKLLIIDERPEATLGLGAAMIPLLEHNAPERLLMGANMLRQWIALPSPEPALIQSGNEPDAPDFWCGRNLLTAFLSWGEDTYEDGIVLSESCARRLSSTHPAEPGDKLSNRHGVKGVVSRILPDDEMPHLADGTPVELIFNFISQHTRAYFGQVREAVLSRIAHAEGRPMLIPPFHAPAEQEIRLRLAQAGLPEDGMEQLLGGRNGNPLAGPSTVGWVYWGKLVHQAREKLQVATENGRGQRLNEYDYAALREAGAVEMIREAFNTSAVGHAEGGPLGQRLARGSLEQAGAPSPQLSSLLKRLDVVGIKVELSESGLAFHLGEPEGVALDLAAPVAHPWLRGHVLTRIGVSGGTPAAYQALAEANVRLWRMLSSEAPASLRQQAQAQLAVRLQDYCATLLPAVQFATRVQFSGRAVLAPGPNLHLDQVGVAEELAWPLFGPLVARELTVEEVQARSEQATRVLDEIMARCWVMIHRSPALTPQTFLAFHPVRIPERVLRLHPLACRLLQADFDGDQAAIFLPLTEQAQQEAGERLAVAAHLARIPELLRDLLPNNEALWGLASLSLTEEGKQQIAEHIGRNIVPAGEIVTRAVLEEALQQILQRDGIPAALELLEKLMRRGFAEARASGASISPFPGSRFPLPPAPAEDEGKLWKRYQQEVSEWLAAYTDYTQPDLGPQLLAVKSGAWGEIEQLTGLLRTQGVVKDILDRPVPIRHGYRDGLLPAELYALAIGARESFAQVQREWIEMSQEIRTRARAQSFHVLARAMRAEQPALVFAHAASTGERDPLTDPDSRLFAGLSVRSPMF
jgi:hypothetical protein